jgi:hypothetical protein
LEWRPSKDCNIDNAEANTQDRFTRVSHRSGGIRNFFVMLNVTSYVTEKMALRASVG